MKRYSKIVYALHMLLLITILAQDAAYILTKRSPGLNDQDE